MKRTLALLALAACTHRQTEGAKPAPPPAASAASSKAAAATTAPAAACHTDDEELPAGVGFGDVICDLPDQIITAQQNIGAVTSTTKDAATSPVTGSVSVRMRANLTKVDTAPIDPKSVYVDTCKGTNGSHAGCSISSGSSIWSKALGSGQLSLRAGFQDSLSDGKNDRLCRGGDGGAGYVAMCSTATRFVAVTIGANGKCASVHASVFEAGSDKESFAVDGDLDPTTTKESVVWTFPRKEGAVTLRFDLKAASAELRVGEQREPCVAAFVKR